VLTPRPEHFSPERWDQLSDKEKTLFWEAWASALDWILADVRGEALTRVTASIAAAREAANSHRAATQR
jgi:hypothetical protein